jgi:hypothetical protein
MNSLVSPSNEEVNDRIKKALFKKQSSPPFVEQIFQLKPRGYGNSIEDVSS